MPIINLTKLTIRIADEYDQVYRTFDPAEKSIVAETSGKMVEIDGVPIERTQITGVKGLPDPEEGTFYIVPEPVAKVLNREDLVVPDTGPTAIRDEKGNVYAVRKLYSISRNGE